MKARIQNIRNAHNAAMRPLKTSITVRNVEPASFDLIVENYKQIIRYNWTNP